MCISNVNATAELIKSITNENEQRVFSMPFDTFLLNSGECSIRNFHIMVNLTLMGTTNEENKRTNVVETNGILYVLIRLTRLSSDINNQLSVDLDRFSIDVSSSDIVKMQACVPYVNYERLLKINELPLPESDPTGNYVLKVLVKTSQDTQWNVQSLSPVFVKRNEK